MITLLTYHDVITALIQIYVANVIIDVIIVIIVIIFIIDVLDLRCECGRLFSFSGPLSWRKRHLTHTPLGNCQVL